MKKYFITIFIVSFISCGAQASISTEIVNYIGTVTVNNQTVTAAHTKIKYGDIISTGEKSSCEIIINDKNILRLNAKTKLVFKISEVDNKLELKEGWLGGVTKKIFAKKSKYYIVTPTVAAGVRGTSFCVKVENPESTYFCVCNGSIDLKGSGESKEESVVAAHHAAHRYKKNADGTTSIDRSPGLLYHGDDGVESLAKTIGVVIDWTRPDMK